MATAEYNLAIDWDNDGDFTDLYDDVTALVLTGEGGTITWSRGRDKRLGSGQAGTLEFSVQLSGNEDLLSPENIGGDLYGLIVPGRPVRLRATYGGIYTEFYGFISRITPYLANDKKYIYFYCVDGMDWLSLAKVNPELLGLYEKQPLGSDWWNCGGTHWLAQTFTPEVSHVIKRVKLKLRRPVGDVPGTVTISIKNTVAGKPSGAALCSATLNGNEVTDSPSGQVYSIELGDGAELVSGTMYCIEMKAPDGDHITDYIDWGYHVGNIYD